MVRILVILAAGSGQRFGRMKQIEPLGPNGESIIDYTLYDAIRAGFNKVVLVTNGEILPLLRHKYDMEKIRRHLDMNYRLQEIPANRTKPWGTGHAVLTACREIEHPFAVVNGDDFYGLPVLDMLCQSFDSADSKDTVSYLIGYRLGNTLSEHGKNARGVCDVDNRGFLSAINEITEIFKTKQGIFQRDAGKRMQALSPRTIVSMNCWRFPAGFHVFLEPLYRDFIISYQNDSRMEFYLPEAVNALISGKKIRVKVLTTEQEWFGVTFAADSRRVRTGIKQLIAGGTYPEKLW
jgi:hypothetical protein